MTQSNTHKSYKLKVHTDLYSRWKVYEQDNPSWHNKFNELVVRLLSQHFDEADTMKDSVQEQEQKRGG